MESSNATYMVRVRHQEGKPEMFQPVICWETRARIDGDYGIIRGDVVDIWRHLILVGGTVFVGEPVHDTPFDMMNMTEQQWYDSADKATVIINAHKAQKTSYKYLPVQEINVPLIPVKKTRKTKKK